MKVLFIGGTGLISSACSRLAIEQGIELYLLNRGKSARPAAEGATVLNGDIRDPQSARAALGSLQFDVVVNWIAFTPAHIQTDLDLFLGRTAQYVFISSASAYQTPPVAFPANESTLLDNPYWEYSRDKIACEELLVQAFRHDKFPATIVRPSHTYDQTAIPIDGGWTTVDRMLRGEKVIVHGDGTSLWTLTHHADFAKGFVGLLGNPRVYGDAIHITSDEWLSWNQIYEMIAKAAGTSARIVHVPSEVIAAYDANWGAGLLGDKTHTLIFDNSKIKRLVPGFACTIPFSRGVEEIIAWYRADPARQKVDERFNQVCDTIIKAQEQVFPKK